jgi:hypothetical protein
MGAQLSAACEATAPSQVDNCPGAVEAEDAEQRAERKATPPWHVRNCPGALEAEDVLRIHPKGGNFWFYFRLPYYPDMKMNEYLTTQIVPGLNLKTHDNGDSVYYQIGWVVPWSDPNETVIPFSHPDETVLMFDRATRNCRLGDMIPPDTDLFIMPIEDRDTLVLYTNNATS